jgi:hypothetical protein
VHETWETGGALDECARRGQTLDEHDFDLDRVYGTLTRLIEGFEIRYDPRNPVPCDDALADRVFVAACGSTSLTSCYLLGGSS